MPYARKRRATRKPAGTMAKPYRAKRRVQYRRRSSASRRVGTQPVRTSVPTPFGKNYYTKLVYADLLSLSSVGGTVAQLTYRLNDCFDPYTGAGGHQPRFFDAFCGPNGGGAPYYSFRVFAAEVTFTLLNTDATGDWSQMFMHWRGPNASQLVDIVDVEELENTISTPMAGENSPSGVRELKKYFKIAPILGHKDLKDVDESAGDVNTYPAEVAYVDVGFIPMDLVNATMLATLQIVYHVQFFDQTYPSQS